MNASNILVDSFAWLEILNGSDRGKIALSVIKESSKVFTIKSGRKPMSLVVG
ncbi:MAG: hypothetical protein GIS02_01915 [Methanosarcinales archaeon]|uniref:Uncharacterized protein n=1 Tax=Candidatus Ethanoperedens thermophilum TaxID=2766897 RepID=A0A848D8Q8_9EURY|nr:hypothetical protein [Candidatus Ethanoperedens thermophilum]